jgi:hypothetical protein
MIGLLFSPAFGVKGVDRLGHIGHILGPDARIRVRQ